METLLNKSGLGWDDNLKMITASPRVYAMHIQVRLLQQQQINVDLNF